MKPDSTVQLTAAGVGLRGPGYPNAFNTLRLLERQDWIEVHDRVSWLPEDVHLWKVARGPLPARVALAARLLLGNMRALLKLVCTRSALSRVVYVPYPSIFLLWLGSWVPRRWRPRLIADAYVSIWDSMFRDRGNSNTSSSASRWLRKFEARALRCADRVLVDTEANRIQFISDFGLSPARVISMPLAIDESLFTSLRPRRVPEVGTLRVLFVGTFIPLHGVDVLARSIETLGDACGIEFEVIGDGQDACVLEQLQQRLQPPNLTWHRQWMSPQAIIERMHAADLCLGVFGGSGKAARVLPFKLYLAMAAGRPVLTQREFSLPAGAAEPPFLLTDPESEQLSEAIIRARDATADLVLRGEASHAYFQSNLGSVALARAWQALATRMLQPC